MGAHPPGSPGALRREREQARQWLTLTCWTAVVTAVFSAAWILLLVLSAPGTLSVGAVTSLLSTALAQGGVGFEVRRGSRWAAWLLLTSYALAVVTSWLTGAWLGGFLPRLVIGGIYVRGFLAADRLYELTTAARGPEDVPA